jgi:hypothetical protein
VYVRELYKSYFRVLPNNLSYWVELVFLTVIEWLWKLKKKEW